MNECKLWLLGKAQHHASYSEVKLCINRSIDNGVVCGLETFTSLLLPIVSVPPLQLGNESQHESRSIGNEDRSEFLAVIISSQEKVTRRSLC